MAMLLLLVTLVAVCAADFQDMSGKMFTFPEKTDTAYVRMNASIQSLAAVTVCVRILTDLDRDHAPFSLATPANDNEFLIFANPGDNEIILETRNRVSGFKGMNFKPNTWHSLCSTWDAESGVGQLWLDGKPSSRKYSKSGSSINGPMTIVLGQDQDSQGGGFDSSQSFVGMMTDVHMWDYIISPCEIKRYTDELSFTPGNILNWGSLSFETNGRVLIENTQIGCYLYN